MKYRIKLSENQRTALEDAKSRGVVLFEQSDEAWIKNLRFIKRQIFVSLKFMKLLVYSRKVGPGVHLYKVDTGRILKIDGD